MRLTLAALLGSLTTALATSITVYLPAKPNPFALAPSTHATLTSLHARHSAPLSAVNTFVFHNVTPGSYLADVHCPTDGFAPLRIDVEAVDGKEVVKAWETFRGNEWANKGEEVGVRDGSAGRGVEVRALGSKTFFVERPKFSVLSILKNPMILMGIGSLGLFMGMPYLMDKMDPELKAEFEAQQRSSPLNNMQAAQNPLSNFDMAGYLSGASKNEGGNGNNGGGAEKKQGVRR